MKSDIDLDIGTNARRIDEVVNSVHLLSQRIEQAEQNVNPDRDVFNDERDNGAGWARGTFANPLDNNDITVVIKDLPVTPEEDLLMKACELISALARKFHSTLVSLLLPGSRHGIIISQVLLKSALRITTKKFWFCEINTNLRITAVTNGSIFRVPNHMSKDCSS